MAKDPTFKILITSPSNVGVDNLIGAIRSLTGSKVSMVRIGNPSRADEQSSEYLFDNVLKQHLKADGTYRKMLIELEAMRRKLSKLKGKNLYTEKAERFALKGQINDLGYEVGEFETSAMRAVLQESRIVAGTLSSIYDRKLQTAMTDKGRSKRLFDYVLVDEAGQALNYLLYISLIHGKRVIFAGDHKQLPPTIKSAENERLHKPLFEELISITRSEEMSGEYSCMLKRQYRMHEDIMRISSEFMYEGRLMADQSVQQKLLQVKEVQSEIGVRNEVIEFTGPLLFVNTFGCLFGEAETKNDQFSVRDKSKMNAGEVELVAFMLLVLKQHYHIQESDIGVITPYSAQVDGITRRLEQLEELKLLEKGVVVSTVDGFQGKEKEVIIMSTVRSNAKNEIGFLSDTRRMNVAITRAKKMLCLIGDENTIKTNEFIKHIIDKMKETGKVMTPEDFDGENVSGLVFKKDNFYRSGVFEGSTENKSKTENKGTEEIEKKKKPTKPKKQKIETVEKVEVFEKEVSKTDDLVKFWKDFCREFVESEKLQSFVYRKIEENEFEILKNVCEELEIGIEKIGKKLALKKTKTDKADNEKVEEVKQEVNEDWKTEQKQLEKPEKVNAEPVKKAKKPKNKKKKELVENEEIDDDEFVKQFYENYQTKRNVCHFSYPSREICGKNIKLLYQECQFCQQFFCVHHGLPENHGCGDLAADYARQQYRGTGHANFENINEDYLREKLKRKLAEEEKKRAPKLKKKN